MHDLVAHRAHGLDREGRRCRVVDTDEEHVAAGARIVDTAEAAWGTDGGLDIVLKVKEPVSEEQDRMREGLVLFTYLHLGHEPPTES